MNSLSIITILVLLSVIVYLLLSQQQKPLRLRPEGRQQQKRDYYPQQRQLVSIAGNINPIRDGRQGDDRQGDDRQGDELHPSYHAPHEITPMITSVYPDVCHQYGSSSVYNTAYEYFPSKWCTIGYITNSSYQAPYTDMTLQAQFYGNSWKYQVLDKVNKVNLRLQDGLYGTGSNQTFRTGDTINNIPGKTGTWTVTIVTDPSFILSY